MPASRRAEGVNSFAFAVGFQHLPKFRVERDAGEEIAHRRQHGVVGLAQFRAVTDRVEVADLAPGAVERFEGRLQCAESAPVIQFRRRQSATCRHRFDCGFRLPEGLGDVGLDMIGRELQPADVKRVVEEGMFHGRADEALAGRRSTPETKLQPLASTSNRSPSILSKWRWFRVTSGISKVAAVAAIQMSFWPTAA